MGTPLVSILIPHHHGVAILKDCLESLRETTYRPHEVLLVDNNSSDGSRAYVRKHHPAVRIIRNSKNFGFAKASNIGIREAHGSLVVLLNNDTEVEPGWLEPLVQVFADARVGAAAPKLKSLKNRQAFDYAGAAGGFLDKFGYPFCRGRLFETVEEDTGQYDTPMDIFWATGTAMAIRKAVIAETGGIDEDFFMHMEEIDLAWRIHLRGYRIRYVPSSVVYHVGGASLKRNSFMKIYFNHRNSLLMLIKNYEWHTLLRYLPRRLMLELVTFLWALAKLNFRWAGAVFASWAWLALKGHIAMRKRIGIKNLRTLAERSLFLRLYRRSVVWKYFIEGRRTFTQLGYPGLRLPEED